MTKELSSRAAVSMAPPLHASVDCRCRNVTKYLMAGLVKPSNPAQRTNLLTTRTAMPPIASMSNTGAK